MSNEEYDTERCSSQTLESCNLNDRRVNGQDINHHIATTESFKRASPNSIPPYIWLRQLLFSAFDDTPREDRILACVWSLDSKPKWMPQVSCGPCRYSGGLNYVIQVFNADDTRVSESKFLVCSFEFESQEPFSFVQIISFSLDSLLFGPILSPHHVYLKRSQTRHSRATTWHLHPHKNAVDQTFLHSPYPQLEIPFPSRMWYARYSLPSNRNSTNPQLTPL